MFSFLNNLISRLGKTDRGTGALLGLAYAAVVAAGSVCLAVVGFGFLGFVWATTYAWQILVAVFG